jgi:membrane protein DedA with SNARE-associated domain
MADVMGALDGLGGAPAYALVGLLALLESAAFFGLAVPGETAMIVGGVLASQGRLSLSLLSVAGTAGAIAGDSVGYALGRMGAAPLRRSRLGARIGERRFAAAEEYLRRRGGVAVFSGRFVGVLRALVPFFAGAGRMPYRRFLAWNAAGAALWAPLCIVLGYVAGGSYRVIDDVAGRAWLLVGGLGAGVVLAFAVWRHLRRG